MVSTGNKKGFSKRILLIGLDGATFDLAKPWMKQGLLPTMNRLVQLGTHGELESTIPPSSYVAWTSLYTGKNPGKHGILAFTRQKKNSYEVELLSGKNCRAQSLWKILTEKGKHVIVLNVPMTYPPEPVNGLLVGGMDSPGIKSNFTYPEKLRDEILSIAPDYVVNLRLRGSLDRDSKREAALEKLISLAEARAKIAHELMDRYPWDFAIVKFDATDQVQHYYWKYMDPGHPQFDPKGNKRFGDAILRVYQKMDEIMKSFVEKIDDDTTVVVMSDHGFGFHSGKVIYINEWLKRIGLLTPKGSEHRRGLLDSSNVYSFSKALVKYVALASKSVLSYKGKDAIQRLFPNLIPNVTSYIQYAGIDWSKTKAYGAEHAGIRINVKGREPQGIVEPGKEYEALRNFIIAEAQKLKDPEAGDRIIEKIYNKEDIYQGDWIDETRDLILITKDNACSINKKVFKDNNKPLVATKRRSGEVNGKHRMNGMLILHGKNVNKGLEIHDSKIIDVAPTILHLLGLPVPDDMDGRVLTAALTDSFCSDNVVQYERAKPYKVEERGGYSEEEENQVKELLEGLGYFDE